MHNRKEMKRKMAINVDRDYIRRGSCGKCKRNGVSIVVHHPRGRRAYSICNYCSKDTWLAVGESNKMNYLKYGEVTKPSERSKSYDRRKRNPRYKNKE